MFIFDYQVNTLTAEITSDLQLEGVELAIIPFEGQEITIAEVVNKVQAYQGSDCDREWDRGG